ncbi:hypothetical protein BC827DRAFT_1274366 [Russula dissimulans]|nr:hypothetical protein BC827DRAFT_1274366 [Russula dissimulans]
MPRKKNAARARTQTLEESRKKRRIQEKEFPEAEVPLDPDLRDLCEPQSISSSVAMDKLRNSDSSFLEDDGDLDSFEEIVEASDLKGFLPLDQFMKQMEKKKLTIANEESKDRPEDHSGPSQGSANRTQGGTNNHSSSEPCSELSLPSSVANGSAHALAHALREEEEENDSEPSSLSNVASSRPHALLYVLREEDEESEASSQEITLVEDPGQLTIDDQSEDNSEAEGIGLGKDVTGLQVQVRPAMALIDDLRHAIPPEAPRSAVDNVLDILNNQSMLCGV